MQPKAQTKTMSTFDTDEHLRTLKAVSASSLKQPDSEFAFIPCSSRLRKSDRRPSCRN
jgi:hypothetical protein